MSPDMHASLHHQGCCKCPVPWGCCKMGQTQFLVGGTKEAHSPGSPASLSLCGYQAQRATQGGRCLPVRSRAKLTSSDLWAASS